MFKKAIKVVMYLNGNYRKNMNACMWYRNFIPMKYSKGIKTRFICDVETEIDFDPINRKVKNFKMDAEPIEWADIVVFSRHYDQIALMGCLSEVAKKMGKKVIYETDDLLHKVELNTGGHNVKAGTIENQLRFVDYVIPNCDLVTVSTDNLNDYYGKKYEKPTVTLPNYYDPSAWRGLYTYKKLRDFWRKKIKKDQTIRIGWQGGNNHFMNNFNYIVEPMNTLKKKYGDKIQFVVMSGMNPSVDLFGGEPGKRKFLDFPYEYKTPVQLKDFPKGVADMDLDIGLIIVEDNEFSRAKSNIKWLEYSLLGIPSISSDCEPYKETNALLVKNTTEEWMFAIEELINNPEKRATIGSEARKMAEEFNIRNHASEWVEAYRKLLALPN